MPGVEYKDLITVTPPQLDGQERVDEVREGGP